MPYRGTGLLEEALDMLREADRMHRQFFTLALKRGSPCWEPPVDLVEDARGITIRIALPGVKADAVDVRTDGGRLIVVGQRPLPAGVGNTIHRLEIPYGRFEREISLPPGRYEQPVRELVDGCLVLTLRRMA